MTLQEAFDIAATGLLTQMATSQDDTTRCLYRGPDGLKCAIGFLIPDNEYKKEFEGCSALHVAWECPSLASLLLEAAFLSSLQNIHDLQSPKHWRECLGRFAKSNNLSPAILETLPG